MTEITTRIQHVTSADGTSIGVRYAGSGEPLLLVHGALCDASSWEPLVPFLSGAREVMALDRRGRGESGDAAEYRPGLEVDDVFAAAMGLHRDVDVLAHSSGALIALRAAERGLPLRRMVLYEPPLMQFRPDLQMPNDLGDQLDALVASGQRDEAAAEFLRTGVGIPAIEVTRLRSLPHWKAFAALAHTTSYDTRFAQSYSLEPRRLAAIKAPVLLLVGSMSPPWMNEGTKALATMLPDARIVELTGHGHNAVFSGPQLVAKEVLAFLEG